MGGQSMQRRDALRVLALATAASSFPGFERWVSAHDHAHPPQKPLDAKPYAPQFFTSPEYASVERLVDAIVPNDGTPGARDAGVAEFVDFMAASDPSLQPRFRSGLAWLEAKAHSRFAHGVAELAPEQLVSLLEPLAYAVRYTKGDEEGQAFFRLMREHTVMGFYSSRVGMEALDNPFLKGYYAELPGCPHHDDREHRRLQKG